MVLGCKPGEIVREGVCGRTGGCFFLPRFPPARLLDPVALLNTAGVPSEPFAMVIRIREALQQTIPHVRTDGSPCPTSNAVRGPTTGPEVWLDWEHRREKSIPGVAGGCR